MRRIRWLALGALVLSWLAGAAPAADKVELKVAKYEDLGKTVKELKGRVIVVDFWSTT